MHAYDIANHLHKDEVASGVVVKRASHKTLVGFESHLGCSSYSKSLPPSCANVTV